MRTRIASSVLLLAALASPCAARAALQAVDEVVRVAPRVQDKAVALGLRKAAKLRARHVPIVHLPVAQTPKAGAADSRTVPLRIGFGREVAELASERATASSLAWEELPGGARVAALGVRSPGAAAMRAAIAIGRLPEGALLRFQGPGEDALFEEPGSSVEARLEANARAGEAGEGARISWSPVVEGDTVLLEIEIPAGVNPGDVRVSIPRISHLFASAGTGFATPTAIGGSASCQVDAMCSSGWSSQRNAVAQMVFSDGGGSYLCTGTLLADGDAATSHPYFLTANHCIATQSAASSLVTYWFYRSSACNSATPGPYRQLTGGATLLHASTATDTSFMRLGNTPPQGAYYAGWQAGGAQPLGTPVAALHQPRGDLLKLSRGAIDGYASCTPPTDGRFTCSGATASSAAYYSVGWSSGITEPGSSGSGLFLADGTLVGQLYGGSSACGGGGSDLYGRFDVAYNAALKGWLSPPLALSVARSGSGTGTVSSSPSGISCGSTCSATFAAGTTVTLNASASPGSTFAGWGGACSGTGACTVTMNSAASVTASFNATAPVLTVLAGGAGKVTSAPSGIDCGTACSASFDAGTVVTLDAVPGPGEVFNGWSGDCSGTGRCSVTMNGARSVAAAFGVPPDLELAQSASPGAIAGRDVAFLLQVKNKGPGPANAVTVTDKLPAGTAFVWASPGCTHAAGTVSCAVGAMGAGGSVALQVVVRPSSAGTLSNEASAAGAETDLVPGNNGGTLAVAVGSAPAGKPILRYRLYSPVTQEHHFTTDPHEYQVLGGYAGTWVQEGTAGRVLDNPGAWNGVAAVPYYRLYNTLNRQHHWTTDANEYYTLAIYPWWNAEGVDGYILPSAAPGAAPLYRLLYPDGRGLHHWTIDRNEYDTLVSTYGWVGEGGSGFVIP